MPARRSSIARAVRALIHERGPLHLDEIVPLIVEAGLTRAKDPSAAVLNASRMDAGIICHPDGRLFDLEDQLEGAVLAAAPLTALERNLGIVLADGWLSLLQTYVRRPYPDRPIGVYSDWLASYFNVLPTEFDFADEDRRPAEQPGSELEATLLDLLAELDLPLGNDRRSLDELQYELRSARVIAGCFDWLPHLEPGQRLGLRIEGGVVRAEALRPGATRGDHVDEAVRTIREIGWRLLAPWDPGPDGQVDQRPCEVLAREFLEWVASESPQLLRRPLPPLQAVLRAAGLGLHRDWVSLTPMTSGEW